MVLFTTSNTYSQLHRCNSKIILSLYLFHSLYQWSLSHTDIHIYSHCHHMSLHLHKETSHIHLYLQTINWLSGKVKYDISSWLSSNLLAPAIQDYSPSVCCIVFCRTSTREYSRQFMEMGELYKLLVNTWYIVKVSDLNSSQNGPWTKTAST